MIRRAFASVTALIAAAVLAGCSGTPGLGPWGNTTMPGEQCIPVAPGHTVVYGMDSVHNATPQAAVLTNVWLRHDHGIRVVAKWAVPTVEGIGSGTVLPPPPAQHIRGFRWDLRQRMDGARIRPSRNPNVEVDLLFVVGLAPGHARGHADGVNIAYRLGGHDYLIPDRIALALSRRC